MGLPLFYDEEKILVLEKAKEMRSKRLIIRKKLKPWEITLQDVLNDEDVCVKRMRISYLFKSMSHIGKITTKEIMQEVGIYEARKIQRLGAHPKKDAVGEIL